MRAGVSFASVNRIQAESIDVPLDQQEGHLKNRLEEDTNGIASQQAPSHIHLTMFFNAILELLDFDFIFLQVHLHVDTIVLSDSEFLPSLFQLFFLAYHVEYMH